MPALCDAYARLDEAVVAACGFALSLDGEAQLLALNFDLDLASRDERGESVRSPGPDGLVNTRVNDEVLPAPDLDDDS